MPQGYKNMKEAAEYLGVSFHTLKKLVTRYNLTVYSAPLNKAVRLLRIEDLDKVKAQEPEVESEREAMTA